MNLENLNIQEMKNATGGMNDRPFGQSDDFGADMPEEKSWWAELWDNYRNSSDHYMDYLNR